MLGIPKEQQVHHLMDEAIAQISELGEREVAEVVGVLERARQVLASQVDGQRNIPLIVSAARWRVADVEKYVVRRIVHDDHVTGEAMSVLVRVRVLCAQVLQILDAALASMRMEHLRRA